MFLQQASYTPSFGGFGLRGPVQQHIDDNKLAMADLEEDIASDSSDIQRRKVQIDDLEGAMQPFDDQMSDIRDEYPDLKLTTATFDEYERLLADRNSLNDQRSAVVAELNGLVTSHNLAVEKLNRLAEETNRLFDEIAWLP